MVDCPTAAVLLEQGYSLGLFGEGTIVFGNQEVTDGNPAQYMSAGADLEAIFKSYIGISYDSAYILRHTTSGQVFLGKMQSLNPTGYYNSSGGLQCNNATDDEGNFLYINGLNNCTAFNFSQLDVNTISPKAASTYDAVKVIVQGLSRISGSFNHTDVDSRLDLYGTLVDPSSLGYYFGATGLVSFSVMTSP